MTLVVEAPIVIEQVIKQLYKLIDVLKVSDLTDDRPVEREMVLVQMQRRSQRRPEIVAIGRHLRRQDSRCQLQHLS